MIMNERRMLTTVDRRPMMRDLDIDRRTPEQRARDHHRALLTIRKRVIRTRQRKRDRVVTVNPKDGDHQ